MPQFIKVAWYHHLPGTLAIGNINKKHGIVMSPLSYIWYSSAKKKLITYAEVMHDVMCS